jgi:hypothetical protein
MPLDPIQKPDAYDVDKFLSVMTEDYSGALTEWDKASSYYLQTYDLWPNISKEEKAHRPIFHSSIAMGVVEQGTDAISTFAPKVTRPPINGSEEAKTSADHVENSCHDLLVDSFVTATEHSAKQSAKHGILYNWMGFSTRLKPNITERPTQKHGEDKEDFQEREEEWSQEQGSWNPFNINALRPGEVFMDPMETNPPIGVRPYKLRAYQAADLALRKAEKTNSTPMYTLGKTEPYDWIIGQEYFSTHWHGVKREAGWLYEPEVNGYGYQPWSHAWGGGGVTPPRTEGFDSKYMARGFLHGVFDDIKMWDQGVAASHTALIRTAFARVGYDGDPGEGIAQLLGTILTGPRDSWWTEQMPTLSPQLANHLETVKADLRNGTFDPQVGGFRQSGVDTATQQILLSDASQRKFIVLNTQLGGQYSIVLSNVLRLATNLFSAYGLTELGVGEHKLTTKDISKNFRIFVSFENIDPVVHQQQKADARAEIALGLNSKAGYWRVARVSDSSGLEDEIMDDTLDAMPEIKAQMLALHAQSRGLKRVAEKLSVAAEELSNQRLGDVAMTDGQGQPIVRRDQAPPAAPQQSPQPPIPGELAGAFAGRNGND